MSRETFFVFGMLMWAAAATAADPAAPTNPASKKLVITPAVEPKPALKYQLLPRFIDQRPGNAAPRYAKAMINYRPDAKVDVQVSEWLELSAAEFQKPETRKAIAAAGLFGVVDQVHDAARLPHCDWELPFRDQTMFMILLPEAHEMRRLGRYVALKARVLLADGKYPDAVATLADGYALARHIAETPTLVNGLVGLAIAAQMDQVVLEFAQTPGAPSLFWAATFQPRPLFDLRAGLTAEMDSLIMSFPTLRPEARSAAEWQVAAQRLVGEFEKLAPLLGDMKETKDAAPWSAMLGHVYVGAQIAMRRDDLREFVVSCGRDKDEVAAMSDSQLLIEFSVLRYEDLRDDMFRWTMLPYPVARRGIDKAHDDLKAAMALGSKHREIIPFATMLLPAVAQVARSHARAERRTDVLRIVEALRLYAGRHEGKLPKSLDEIADVPVPKIDTMTGKPFLYVLNGQTAELTLPEERNSLEDATLVYEISVHADAK